MKPVNNIHSVAYVEVPTSEDPSRVYFNVPLPDVLNALTPAHTQTVIITDENVLQTHMPLFQSLPIPTFPIPSGEPSKSLTFLESIYSFFHTQKLDRHAAVIAIGGGMVSDIAGFAAATYLRGIPLYTVPTTLLAMVDGAIGGKTAINLPYGKNLIGAFYPARNIYMQTEFLKTLPDREFNSGFAEIIKYGLLGNKELLDTLTNNPTINQSSPLLDDLLLQSCTMKANYVAADEKDRSGTRAFLNLGHTFGHALEAATNYEAYLHGEAVALGLLLACKFSETINQLPSGTTQVVKALLSKYSLPTELKSPVSARTLTQLMHVDKKAHNDKVNLILLDAHGNPCHYKVPDSSALIQLWQAVGANSS